MGKKRTKVVFKRGTNRINFPVMLSALLNVADEINKIKEFYILPRYTTIGYKYEEHCDDTEAHKFCYTISEVYIEK